MRFKNKNAHCHNTSYTRHEMRHSLLHYWKTIKTVLCIAVPTIYGGHCIL